MTVAIATIRVKSCGEAYADAGPLGRCPFVIFVEGTDLFGKDAIESRCGLTRRRVDTDAGLPRSCPINGGLSVKLERA